MKNLKLIFSIALVLIAASAAFAQGRINGKVVEIVDGRTVVIELPNRARLVAELQYVEVPELGQPLNDVAKTHLRELVLDKIIEFRANGLTAKKTVGQLFLNGVDISQQMIRDGAAWYAVLEKNRQDAAESSVYQTNEAQAKNERRGIWSIENLKPSWEIRAEAEARRRQQEALAQEAYRRKQPQHRQPVRQLTNNDFQMWADVNSRAAEDANAVGGLAMKYDAAVKMGYVATTRALFDLAAKNSGQRVDFRMAYIYRDWERGRASIYLVGILSEAEDWKFLKSNSLTVIADGRKLSFGRAIRLYRRTPVAAQEFLVYKISRSTITKIVKAKNVQINLGVYSGELNDKLQIMLKNLLEASS